MIKGSLFYVILNFAPLCDLYKPPHLAFFPYLGHPDFLPSIPAWGPGRYSCEPVGI